MNPYITTELIELDVNKSEYGEVIDSLYLNKVVDSRNGQVEYEIYYSDDYWQGDYSESWDVTKNVLKRFPNGVPDIFTDDDKAFFLAIANNHTHYL